MTRLRGPFQVAAVIALLHGVNDCYTAFLHPLLPRIMAKLDLSIALAATLTMTLSLAASLAQPLLGHLADRGRQRALVVLGPVATAVFLSSIGLAPEFGTLLLLLAIGGLGSAAFHPPGAAMAVRAGGSGRSATRHAVFSFGGALGYAGGPLIAVAIVHRAGLEGLWVAMLPMLALAPIAYVALPRPGRQPVEAVAPTLGSVGRLLGGPLGLVLVISMLNAFLQRLFLTLQPIIIARGGGTEAFGAVALTAYLGGQAAGTLSGGLLADRLDRRRLLTALTVLSLPAHVLAFLYPGGVGGLALASIAGCLNQASLPALVVMAIEIAPRNAGVAAGIVMGLAWAIGSVGVLGAGALGDLVGPQAAAVATTPVILLATAVALHPRLRSHGRPTEETMADAGATVV